MPWVKCKAVFDPKAVGLCGTPYHGHKRGCSNFCKKSTCPPTMLPLDICLDDIYFIYITFPIRQHVKEMQRRHPEWTIYQARNIRYWQRITHAILQKEVDKFLRNHPNYRVPSRKFHLESYGIDVAGSLAQAGIQLDYGPDWAHHELTYEVRYGGIPLEQAGKRRLARLSKEYPSIYDSHKRVGKCKGCLYRPCLKFIISNASLYVGQQIDNIKIVRLVKDRAWLIKCDCGRSRLIPMSIPLCRGFSCVCGAK